MRRGGGAAKGSDAERRWSRLFSCWWYDGDQNYLWRRPGPGSRFFKNPDRHTGDICPVADRALPHPFPWHIECKSVRSLELSCLLTNHKKSFIYKVWQKAVEEARRDLDVMLMVKENRRPELVFLTTETYQRLGWDYSGPEIMFPFGDDIVVGLPWDAVKGQTVNYVGR